MQRQVQISAPRAKGILRRCARTWHKPYVELAHAAHKGGLLTTEGFLHCCGQRYFLKKACDCVVRGVPEFGCRRCQGTGAA